MKLTHALGSIFGVILFYIVPIRKRLILNNLTLAFGKEKSKKEIKKLILQNYQNYTKVFFELMFFRTKRMYKKHVEVNNMEIVEAAFKKGNGILFLGAHMGNWEIVINSCFLKKLELYFVVKKIKTKWASLFFQLFRVKSGLKLIEAQNTYHEIASLLKKNKAVGFAMDQHKGTRGVFVEFFGRLASTNTSFTSLALKTGATVIPVHCYRKPNTKGYMVEFQKPVAMVKTENLDFDIFYNTQIVTKIIEGWIRKYPDQWFWGHKRWKGKYEAKQAVVPTLPFNPDAYAEYLNT